jgi:nucleoside-diphosphate-sugar epimerase
MRAFVTGASGFIGTHLVQELLRQTWEVSALLHHRSIAEQERIRIFRGDIRDSDILKDALKGTDVLFHLAAALGASLIHKREFFEINAEGTENVFKAAQQAGVKRIIHFSSAGVLGSVKENQPAGEDYPLFPQDVYDQTKLEGERIALRHAKEGRNVVVVRPGWVYGPGDRRTLKLIKAVAKKRFILVTKGNVRQTPVHIDDLIRGVLLCNERANAGEVFHLAGEEVLSVKEIVETIGEVTGTKIFRFPFPLFSVKVASWKIEKVFSLFGKEAPLTRGKLAFFIHPKPLSIRKAKQDLGYSPQIDFKKGMHGTVTWYRTHGWLP